jgi:hypothetical protein
LLIKFLHTRSWIELVIVASHPSGATPGGGQETAHQIWWVPGK